MVLKRDSALISIIIPAHNEEGSISESLTSLLDGANPKDMQVIVICNGCTDLTAQIVKNNFKQVTCIETEVASKTHAMNIGDQAALHFPRVYLDADVIVNANTITAMNKTLQSGVLITAPEVQMDFDNCSWLVKAFYDIWLSLPYCKADMIGSGLYALSEKGRARFGTFPDVINDDGYVRHLFSPNERVVTTGCFSVVKAPKSFLSLIKVKTRVRLGQYELKEKFPQLFSNIDKNYSGTVKDLLFDFKIWPKLIIYMGINLTSRCRARFQYLTKQQKWERDETTRKGK